MYTLDQWNAEKLREWSEKIDKVRHPERHSNGIACPKCLEDGLRTPVNNPWMLYDTGQMFTGPPDRLRVKCMNPDCNFKGERLDGN